MMNETPNSPFPDEEAGAVNLFDLLDHFCAHIKLSAGASTSAANTAESYANALKVFKRFIRHSYSRKRGFKAPYPVSILDSDILLAYHDWLTKTPPSRKKQRPSTLVTLSDDQEAGVQASTETLSPPPPKPRPARYAPATVQYYLAAVKRFLTWGVSQDFIKRFDLGKSDVKLKGGRGQAGHAYPHRKIDPNLVKILLYYDNQPLPKEPPDTAELSNLARYQLRRRQLAVLRNRAIVYTLFDTGLRVSELTGLKRDEIDRAIRSHPLPEDVGLQVVGKGGRQRTVWITGETLAKIRDYLEARDDPSEVLFVGSKKGVPITRQMVWKIVKDGAKAAGVGDFTGPHAFRHWLARQLFNDEENPVPMEDVQALLGHASPTTTRTIYAPHSSKTRLRNTIRKARRRPEDIISDDERPE